LTQIFLNLGTVSSQLPSKIKQHAHRNMTLRSQEHLIKLTLTFGFSGEMHELVLPSQDTVSQLKQRLSKVIGRPPCDLRLCTGARLLSDHEIVAGLSAAELQFCVVRSLVGEYRLKGRADQWFHVTFGPEDEVNGILLLDESCCCGCHEWRCRFSGKFFLTDASCNDGWLAMLQVSRKSEPDKPFNMSFLISADLETIEVETPPKDMALLNGLKLSLNNAKRGCLPSSEEAL